MSLLPLVLSKGNVLREPQWHHKARMSSSLRTHLGNDSSCGGVLVPLPYSFFLDNSPRMHQIQAEATTVSLSFSTIFRFVNPGDSHQI